MNRIRKWHNKWQVLITPTYVYSPSVELMLGNFTDENLRGYYIVEYNDLQSAQCEALKLPDIPWYKLISMHKDIYNQLCGIIRGIINKQHFIAEVDCSLMNTDTLKNTMFDRVMIGGNRFTLAYNMNDIIGINIINPWSKNLVEISKFMETDPRLRIYKKYIKYGTITLVGVTDIGTSYEIKLWPTLIAQWARWVQGNYGNDTTSAQPKIQQALTNTVKLQDMVDRDVIIR
ncbi:MAG: hypothetical protein Edafosvirus10_16 [Edafosvirus sp.]|uniref:Uncharacterized protein n=1 Tax=Edafosvirus sp. TaxID=2487765 RepID=A0A3G4ZWH6_9VIRU|nr:MAG: hypothetical protein Edafosvirus10_16 [Edafosvirus sp.]